LKNYVKNAISGLSQTGVDNLLQNCAHVKPGERVLIIGEKVGTPYFDDNICELSAQRARNLGAHVDIIRTAPLADPENFPLNIAEAIQHSDHTIFFSRLGDQLRFCPLPGRGTKTMCYATTEKYLSEDFCAVPYGLFKDVHDLLVDLIASSRSYRISCPRGTALEAHLPDTIKNSIWSTTDDNPSMRNFSVEPFPVMIFPPLDCLNINGKLTLSNWLTSTSTHIDDESVLFVPSPVVADIENSRISNLHGDLDATRAVESFYQSKGGSYGDDVWSLNSWHAGIYPKTFYDRDAREDPEHWGNMSFGSPRFTHFHTCGPDPGRIAINVIDATISFDDQIFWQDGKFSFLEHAETRKLLKKHNVSEEAFEQRWDIGIQSDD